MRIDAYNQISQLYQASKPKKITKKSEATVKEQYTVSSKGQDYQIASGSYNVSAQEIADSVVSKFFDSSI